MREPKRFCGLHGHTGMSVMDGLGAPADHFKFCIENGLDAHALTEHGHMNSFSNAYLLVEKWHKEGKKFKYLPGVEIYIHPDFEQWKKDRQEHADAVEDTKASKKLLAKLRAGVVTDLSVTVDSSEDVTEINSNNALTIENEEESKAGKSFNPINRRHHMVILPKNSQGLLKVFNLVSRGYLEGFYRFPRIDAKMLKEAAKDGDLLISTACIAGTLNFATLSQLRYIKFDELNASVLDDPSVMAKVLKEVSNTYDLYSDAVGRDNVLLELQFNKLPAQDVCNRAILEFAKRNGLTNQLVVTPDSHYPRPELWKHREMYKKLGYMNYADLGADSLPKSKDELKCELYPKNATQLWEEYNRSKSRSPFYDVDGCDDLVCDAIERTYDIAHSVIGDVTYDKSYKYPHKIVPEDTTPFKLLCKLAREGLIKRGLDSNPEYVSRLKYELEIIKKMDNASYFVTLAEMMRLAKDVVLLGIARGSSGGSLVVYCLYITDLDPIKYDCQFERFLNVHRHGAPDCDIDVSDRDKVLTVFRERFGYNNVIPISNVNAFKVKSLVKDLSKFYGVPFDEATRATVTVEQDVRKTTLKAGDDKNLFVLTYEDALKYSPSFKAFIDKYPEITESMSILFKEQRSLGRHAGGVVIMDDAPNSIPLITNSGEPQTPWVEGVGGKFLEPMGILKYDILGLETMRLIERTIELILKSEGVSRPEFKDVRAWYEKHLHPDVNNYDDQTVYEHVYHDGSWAGIFQLSSSGAQRLFLKAKPRSIVDIAVLTSIYRPGPLASGVDKIYLEAKAGKKFEWGHPLFEKVLGDTYNVLIFQESVMKLAEIIGGFPKDQCDNVRRAIMKRDLSKGESAKKEAKDLEDQYVQGAMKQGISEETARKSYETILVYAGYGFNRTLYFRQTLDIVRAGTSLTCQINEVKENDLVPSWDQKTNKKIQVKVKKLINNGKKPIVKVTLKDGSTVKCSMNHRFRTTCGYTLSLAEIIDKKLSIATLDHFSHTHAQSAAEE